VVCERIRLLAQQREYILWIGEETDSGICQPISEGEGEGGNEDQDLLASSEGDEDHQGQQAATSATTGFNVPAESIASSQHNAPAYSRRFESSDSTDLTRTGEETKGTTAAAAAATTRTHRYMAANIQGHEPCVPSQQHFGRPRPIYDPLRQVWSIWWSCCGVLVSISDETLSGMGQQRGYFARTMQG
jgi:hypothetical protein